MRLRTTLAVAALAVYFAMWAGYLQGWSWLKTVDDWLLNWFYSVGAHHPGWAMGWDVFCTIFGPAAFRIVTLVIIVWLAIRRRTQPALFLLVSVELSGVVTVIAKALANRARPDTALAYAASSSFPSGHALGVMVCVLALLTVFLPMIDARWHAPLVVAGTVIVIAIGVGRVVLNVHHPSDVVAGWALGYVYYLLCLPLLTARAGRRATRDTSR